MAEYLNYSDDLEKIESDEPETIEKIIDVHIKGMHIVRDRDKGPSIRISHAKAHAILTGELIVEDDLPPELAQGLFAKPARYPVVVRMATAPGEVLDDRKVPTARGMAVKVFDVAGEKLPGHEDATTQDFVFNTGKAFVVNSAKAFLAMFTVNATVAPKLPQAVKSAVSTVSHAANTVLHVVGGNSAKLDFLGHAQLHPLAESYYSQVPLRYGNYVAKLSFTPASPGLKALLDQQLKLNDENGLRTVITDYCKSHGVEFDVNVQLAIDEKQTPIEDAKVEWPEDVSPYRRVAHIVLPPQDAFDPALQKKVDYDLSFAPAHALAAHRPLGSIMRARLATYPKLAALRRSENSRPIGEPTSIQSLRDGTGARRITPKKISFVETSVLRIAYEHHLVEGSAAVPVILLHGWPDDVRTWDRVSEKLHAKGHPTIAPWLRGYGATSFRHQATPRSGQVVAFAQDVIDLMDALSLQKAAIVGHDWGARAAYALAALWPERISWIVSCSGGYETGIPGGDEISPDQAKAYWYQWFWQTERGKEALTKNRDEVCRYLWRTWSPGMKFTEDEFAVTSTAWLNPDWVDGTLHAYRVRWGNAEPDPRYAALETRLLKHPKIDTPTVVLHGEDDGASLVDSSAGQEGDFTSHYERRALPGVGHFIPREAPDAVLDAVETLSVVTASANEAVLNVG